MATNELFQQHVTCPVCLGIFVDPHSLECRHIVCLPCLDRLKDRGRVQCPECREEMPFKKIKRDFKTKKLAESLKKEKEGESKEVIPDRQPNGCEVCHILWKAVVSKCKTCDKYLCQSCEVAHKGIPVTKNHVLVSEAEIVSAVLNRANTILKKSEEDLEKVERSRSDISASIIFINEKKKSQEAEVDVRINRLVRQLEIRRAKLKHDLNKGNDNILDTLAQNKLVFDRHRDMLEAGIYRLTEQLSSSNDLKTLMEPTAMITCNLSEASIKIDDDIRRLECNIQDSPVKVVNGPDCNVETYVTVHKTVASYADLMTAISVQEEHYEVKEDDENIVKMCIIGDEIWCCGGDKIRIFDRDCALQREIPLSIYQSTFGLTKGLNDDIFLATAECCAVLNSEFYCLIEGHFSDVCYYNKCLYAVDYVAKQVYILEKHDSIWEIKFKWEVEDAITLDNDSKMFVNRYGVFISSRYDSRIYLFSHKGDLLQTAGRSSDVGGILKDPIMCGVDSDGIVLIGDYANSTFQLYNSNDRSWQVIKSLGKIDKPVCAVLDGNDMFISKAAQLLKYKLV